jgi:hypothetical protein
MTKLGFVLSAALVLGSAAAYAFAGDRDFDGLVSGIAQSYDLRATKIPMMSMVSLCARVATHGGVKGLRVVEFDNIKISPGLPDLTSLVHRSLGPEWEPFVQERDRRGESQSVIFVRPAGEAMRMVIADYDHGELDLIRMELSGNALARWMKNPQAEAHRGGGRVPGSQP